ncbi:hypothetical protein BST30_00100 [Mycobacterium mantenii]|uniref:Uncharacterized protein n=1 Tax=Mycobacterium mantenii TaxID=560555 RepID=A0A1X0G4V2_MYCNT|nr:hypothetical protein BST30_00100 [Mycobacterium mantenii]
MALRGRLTRQRPHPRHRRLLMLHYLAHRVRLIQRPRPRRHRQVFPTVVRTIRYRPRRKPHLRQRGPLPAARTSPLPCLPRRMAVHMNPFRCLLVALMSRCQCQRRVRMNRRLPMVRVSLGRCRRRVRMNRRPQVVRMSRRRRVNRASQGRWRRTAHMNPLLMHLSRP